MKTMKLNALTLALCSAMLSGMAAAQSQPQQVYLLTRGELQPAVPESESDDSEKLEPNRRVSIVRPQQPGVATAIGKFSIELPDGGVIWATEDPQLGQPILNAQGPALVAFENGRIAKPVTFHGYSNYTAFIEKMEVSIYDGRDVDLVKALATISMPLANVGEAEWDGALPDGLSLRYGDELQYVVRAYGRGGQMDETHPRRMQLAKPDEVLRGAQLLRDSASKAFGESLGVDEAQDRSLQAGVFGESNLRLQNIPLYGSRVRVQGSHLPGGMLKINGQTHPVDLERKMVAEYLLPVGKHRFDIELGSGQDVLRESLDVDVTGRYMLLAALADLTASKNKVTGSIEPLAGDERYDGSLYLEGRLAFYLKGKVKGKYLVTAQADTQEREVSELFNGFWDADPQDVFRRLDPDQYYPVYGDDSTTYRDIDTQGRLYVRVDWDKNQVLWGNYNTGFTGNEYAQYNRSLYGAAVNWRSQTATPLGDPRSELRGFFSQAQTAPGHSEFAGTGGSLYYLRHTDVLRGSDKLVVEVRDRTTGRVEERVTLQRGTDYEIDELQGRVLLTRPLSQVTRQNLGTLTRDTPLDGFEQRLIVDYEYLPSGVFSSDEATMGVRGRKWFGDHVALGATWVDENRAGDDYSQRGVDLTLQAGRGTYIKLEHAESSATSAPVFFSDNGGFSFAQLNPTSALREGDANSVEARVNFRELGMAGRDSTAAAWWREVDAGYSVSRFDYGLALREYGTEWLWQPSDALRMLARYSRAERDADSLEQIQITGDWRINERVSLGAELRHVDELRAGAEASGTLAALKYQQRIGTHFEAYGIAQATLDDDGGRYADNDAVTLGGRYNVDERGSLGAEVTTGDRGDAAQVNAEYRLTPEHSLYGKYTYSTDTTAYDPLFNNRALGGWTFGQRWRLSNQVALFNESQNLKDRQTSGLAHTFGMDFYPSQGWNFGFNLQSGDLERVADGGQVDRRAYGINGGFTSPRGNWSSKIEYREDRGTEQREQWVSTNHATLKLSESLRVGGRLNYSKTNDAFNPQADAKFVESNIGLAWRPVVDDRWALLARYTYLYDLSSLAQDGGAQVDQRSQVFSIEGIHRLDQHWEVAAKYAHREGEVRTTRGSGPWFDSTADFAALQARYELIDRWHLLGEYRWLDVKSGGTRNGLLLGVDRDISDHFRVGVGYNFTEFSDDLTDFDYKHRGWFVNFVGYY